MHTPKNMRVLAQEGGDFLRRFNYFDRANPKIMIVLGSGCDGISEKIEVVEQIEYSQIPGMPESTVKDHKGKLILGFYEGSPVLGFRGRAHYYEGHSAQKVSYPMYLAKELGLEFAMMTTAAGIAPSPRPWYYVRLGKKYPAKVGELMLMESYFPNNLPSSLRGILHSKDQENRFNGTINLPDVTLGSIAQEVAKQAGWNLKGAIYVPREGPNYETPAEVQLLTELSRVWRRPVTGGMSVIPEIEAASMLGIRTLPIIVVTNQCFDLDDRSDITKVLKRRGRLLDSSGRLKYEIGELTTCVEEAVNARQPDHDHVGDAANDDMVAQRLEALMSGVVRALH